MRRLLWLCVVLVLVPGAAGHVQPFSDARSIALGPYSASLYPRPMPLYANESTQFDLSLIDSQGRLATKANASLRITEPGTPNTWDLVFDATPQGYKSPPIALPRPGNYSAALSLEEGGQTHTGEVSFQVYPDLPVRIHAPADVPDPALGKPWRFRFEVRDADTNEPAPEVSDLRVRAERWSDDHAVFISAAELTLQPWGPGVFEGEHTFREEGMVHVWLASDSGGFEYGQTPMWHVYVARPADGGSNGGIPLPTHVSLLALGAMAWLVSWQRRRGPPAPPQVE